MFATNRMNQPQKVVAPSVQADFVCLSKIKSLIVDKCHSFEN